MKYYVKKMKMRSMNIWITFCPNGEMYFEHSWGDAMARVQISIAEPTA